MWLRNTIPERRVLTTGAQMGGGGLLGHFVPSPGGFWGMGGRIWGATIFHLICYNSYWGGGGGFPLQYILSWA